MRCERSLGDKVGLHVGTAKTIDSLLRVAHKKEGTRPDGALLPRQCQIPFTGETPEDLGLQWVGILELIDQDSWIARGQSSTHGLVSLEEIACVMQQVVEVEQSGLSLVVA